MIAHSGNQEGIYQPLGDHLKNVALRASVSTSKFAAGELGYWAGMVHDIGKAHPEIQAYLYDPGNRRGPDHSTAGAAYIAKCLDALSFVIAGHHGGLPSKAELKSRLSDSSNRKRANTAIDLALKEIPDIIPPSDLMSSLPHFVSGNDEESRFALEMFIRFLYSALVDADFLDTEAHFNPEKGAMRAGWRSLEELWQSFEEDQLKITGRKNDLVNRVRHEIYGACVAASAWEPGCFSLTVPTGGGKTRSSMAFALLHALRYGMDRVIVAIPYTSIIEQTADVYEQIFGKEAVLEHHSGMASTGESECQTQAELRASVAAENWDAPIVVTTTVQFFESLFSNKPGRCRKLHNIARSVVILDEVQTLPAHLLKPTLDVLQELVDHYRVSVVLCTATQPALDETGIKGGPRNVREIVPEPQKYFDILRRVTYEFPASKEDWTWDQVASVVREEKRCLVVVNTKSDALALLDALAGTESVFHLSGLLCGAHRRDVLKAVRQRLENKYGACRLVSTQVVEAGVDLDFPVVLRAIGPLDRIIQAAGRCNREGRGSGRVVVFKPAQGGTPPGEYRGGTGIFETLIRGMDKLDPYDLAVVRSYFRRLYENVVDIDACSIQALRRDFDYPEVARRFRLIDDDTVPVVVPYRSNNFGGVDGLIDSMHACGSATREMVRNLQPYVVNIRRREVEDLVAAGLMAEIVPGIWEWLGKYDPVKGLVVSGCDPEQLIV